MPRLDGSAPARQTGRRLGHAARRRLRWIVERAIRAARPLRRAISHLRARPGPARVHLGWSEDPCRSLTVTWRTAVGLDDPRVEVEAIGGGSHQSIAGTALSAPTTSGHLYRAVLRGLEPDTEYAYRVCAPPGVALGAGAWHRARTAPSRGGAPFDAVFLCDVGIAGRRDGTTDATADVLEAIAAQAPLFVLGGGDYAYANRDARFLDPADAITCWLDQMQLLFANAPFLAQLGNHDVELGERYEDWSGLLAHPPGSGSGRSFSFDVGAAHIAGLFAPGRTAPEAELRWLAADLEGTRAREAAWRIVFQHAPVFAHGRAHPTRPESLALVPLLERLGVDLHLSGHDQSYERTPPIRAGVCAAPLGGPGALTRYATGNGVVYAKVSPAGKLSERGFDFSRFAEPPPPEIAVRDDRHHHWALLRVSERTLEVRIDGLAPDGKVAAIDHFALVRPGPAGSALRRN